MTRPNILEAAMDEMAVRKKSSGVKSAPKKSKTKQVMPEPIVADVPTSDEPKRLMPVAEPTATSAPDEPKRLMPAPEPVSQETPDSPVDSPAQRIRPPRTPEQQAKYDAWKAMPNFGTPEWTAARKQQLAAMSPEERKAEKDTALKRVGIFQTKQGRRGIGDRLRSAWKSFTAAPDTDLGKAGSATGQRYKSVFHEIQRLMEQYQLIEMVLHEQSLYEGLQGKQKALDVAPPFGKLTADDFATLRGRKNKIREALAEHLIREELYRRQVTMAELNENQRTALMETMKSRCDEMFGALSEAKLSPEDAENILDTHKAHDDFHALPSDTVDALGGAAKDAKYRKGKNAPGSKTRMFHQHLTKLAKKHPTPIEEHYSLEEWLDLMEGANQILSEQESHMEEQYTLEEWMGMMEEAGYNLNELSPETLASYRDKAADQRRDLAAKHTTGKTHIDNTMMQSPDAIASGDTRKYFKRGTGIGRAQSNLGQGKFTDGSRERGISDTESQKRSKESWGKRNDKLSNLINPRVASARTPEDPYSHLRGSVPDVDKYAIDADRKRALKYPTAPSPTMQEKVYTIEEWMGMMEEAGIDEGKLSRLAAGLGLGAAAMMGGAKDAEAQSTTPQQTVTAPVPNDSVQTGVSRDMGLAQTKAGFELDRRGIDRQGARMTPKQNPDGTWSVTIDARKQPTTGTPQMEQSYTLDEWMGMMEEAGYDVSEYRLWRPEESGAKASGVMKDPKKPKEEPKEPKLSKKPSSTVDERVNAETISENTVSRLQELAGIQPLNG